MSGVVISTVHRPLSPFLPRHTGRPPLTHLARRLCAPALARGISRSRISTAAFAIGAAMASSEAATGDEVGKSVMGYLQDWGSSSMPPALLATLVTALHARPLQALPLVVFTPPLLFASYLNLAGYPTGSAGTAAAWSGLYALLALRRRQPLRAKASARGLVRAAAVGLGAVNCAAGGWVYFRGDFERDERERARRNRWADKK